MQFYIHTFLISILFLFAPSISAVLVIRGGSLLQMCVLRGQWAMVRQVARMEHPGCVALRVKLRSLQELER